MRQVKLTSDQIHDVDAVIAGVIRRRYGNPPYPAAMQIQGALREAGFEIVPKVEKKPAGADLLTDVIREAMEDVYDAGYEGRPVVGGEAAARLIREFGRVGLHVVHGPLGKDWREVLRQQDAERQRAVELGLIPPPGTTISAPAADADEDEAPETDTWGLRACLADDVAARHGCRVELSGIDNPHMPLTPVDDMTAYAVVTERGSGRLVGIVECWQCEDGDYIVPRSWLETTLSAWDAKRYPMRAA